MLLFADIETTGLDPQYDKILEVGFAITDDELNVQDMVDFVVFFDVDKMQDSIDPFVIEMHTNNGLWDECKQSKMTVHNVTNAVYEWLNDHSAFNMPLCGNTISFDKGFLQVHMPRVALALDYHLGDFSSIKLFNDRWGKPVAEEDKPQDRKLHRVVPDMQDSIARAAFYRRTIWGLDNGTVTREVD